MNLVPEQHNPFQPPTTGFVVSEDERLAEIRLGMDAEFGMSTRYLIARADFTLPPICITTGRTDGLQRMRQTFRFPAPFWGRLLLSARIVAVIVLLQLMPQLELSSGVGLPHSVFAVLSFALLLSPLLTYAFAESVQATWYVARSVTLRKRILYTLAFLTMLAAIGTLQIDVIAIGPFQPARSSWYFVGLVVLAAVLLAFQPNRLSPRGKVRELFVLTGFSHRFYDQVLARRKSNFPEGEV